jgi:hydrogenase maturation protease
MKRILIAGIGNIFLGDDAFGVQVAQELSRHALPPEARVVDFGIRSYDLAYALTENCDAAILVDAVPRGGEPGTVYLMQLDRRQIGSFSGLSADAHSLNPLAVLQLAENFGTCPEQLYLVGCEPAEVDNPDGLLGLSAPVAGAVPQAIAMVESLLERLLSLETQNESGFAPV